MTILFYILMVVVLLVSGGLGARSIHARRTYGLPYSTTKNMSWPSQQILKEYNKLPEENRPYASLSHILTALDTKNEASSVNHHFVRRGYDATGYSWDCGCWQSESNPCQDYKNILNGIKEIKVAVEKHKHAIMVAGVESGLSDLEELTSRLKEEKELVENITKEVTQR